MPLLGFTKLKDKLLDGSKTQTIRKPRKHPIKLGDKLYVYWKLRTKQCEKLGEAIVTKIVSKSFYEINEEDAVLDGFNNFHELHMAFKQMHPHTSYFTRYNIITFEWTRKDA